MKKIIFKNERLDGWKIKKEKGGGGVVLFSTKTIVLGEDATFSMFLHEVSHAVTKENPSGIFADKFTQLVDKYMSKKVTNIK